MRVTTRCIFRIQTAGAPTIRIGEAAKRFTGQ
jgi:hypothetical protein